MFTKTSQKWYAVLSKCLCMRLINIYWCWIHSIKWFIDKVILYSVNSVLICIDVYRQTSYADIYAPLIDIYWYKWTLNALKQYNIIEATHIKQFSSIVFLLALSKDGRAKMLVLKWPTDLNRGQSSLPLRHLTRHLVKPPSWLTFIGEELRGLS